MYYKMHIITVYHNDSLLTNYQQDGKLSLCLLTELRDL